MCPNWMNRNAKMTPNKKTSIDAFVEGYLLEQLITTRSRFCFRCRHLSPFKISPAHLLILPHSDSCVEHFHWVQLIEIEHSMQWFAVSTFWNCISFDLNEHFEISRWKNLAPKLLVTFGVLWVRRKLPVLCLEKILFNGSRHSTQQLNYEQQKKKTERNKIEKKI